MNKVLFHVGLTALLLVSCTRPPKDNLGTYENNTIFIDTNSNIALDTNQYEVVDVIPLGVPKNLSPLYSSQLRWVDDRIYIMDSEYNKSVLVFDDQGNYMHKLGAKGHARNEYIDSPTYFMVGKDGAVHVYERNSIKVIKFDSEGNVVDVFGFRTVVPSGIELTDDGNYLCSFDRSCDGDATKLSIISKEGEIIRKFMYMPEDETLASIGNGLFKENDIAYIPLLSDSIIVISSDTVNSVWKIDFGDKFNPEEIRKKCLREATYLPLYEYEDGAQFIDGVEMSDSLLHISYAYNLVRSHFVVNRNNKKTYNTLTGTFFNGITLKSDFTIVGNKLVYYITDDDVELVKTNMDNPEHWQQSRKCTHPVILDIIDKKIPTPVLISIRLK